MNDDFQDFRLAYLRIQEDLERLTRTIAPSYRSTYEQMERSLEPIRRQHLELTQSLEISGLAPSPLVEIVQANRHWQGLFDKATASSRVFEDLKNTHQTWLDLIEPVHGGIAQLQAAAKLSLGDVAYRLTITEQLFSGIDFEALKRSVALPDPAFLKIQETIGGVTSTYKHLADSIRNFPDLTRLPVYTLPGATREIFTTSYALNEAWVADEPERERDAFETQLIAEAEQETSECIGLLEEIDPDLVQSYIGALDALRSKSVDRTRHAFVSWRELLSHLLHRLSPDDALLAWVANHPNKEKLLHKGKPKRKARILYIYRSVDHKPLSNFVVHEVKALLVLMEVFHRIHECKLELTDEQLRALRLRIDSWLTYILQIWKGEVG